MMSDFLKLVGSRVRQIRKQRGLTQEELAERIGFQFSYIGGIERGERNISILTLEKLSKGLQVTPEELLNFKKLNITETDLDKRQSLNAFMQILNEGSYEELKLIQKIYFDIIEHCENTKR